jgi:hypothetical protein
MHRSARVITSRLSCSTRALHFWTCQTLRCRWDWCKVARLRDTAMPVSCNLHGINHASDAAAKRRDSLQRSHNLILPDDSCRLVLNSSAHTAQCIPALRQ